MKKKNEKGFFLSETILVITVVAVILLGVFKLFSSVYYGFKESENYNTVNAINALSNVQKYFESIGDIDISLLSDTNTYIDLTNEIRYSSDYYTRIKEEFNITNVYLIDLIYFFNSNDSNNFPVLLRRYMKTLKNIEGIVMVIVVNGNEFSYVKVGNAVHIELVGDKDDEYGVYLNVGETFEDPGYTGWDGDAPNIEWENNNVLNINKPGTYYLHYNFDGYIFRRKVMVGNYNAEFSYTGSEQEFRVNAPGYYKIEAWGAQGGNSTNGGKGGYSSGVIKLNAGEKLYIYVGEMGPSNDTVTNTGGYNGGGYSGNNSEAKSYGGGGATDIRLSGGLWNDITGLNNRIIVAAGGAGTTSNLTTSAGNGGGLVGGKGTSSNSSYNTSTYLPIGSGQSAAGFAYETTARAGSFGYAIQANTSGWGGGGGGGYYGGGNGHGTTGAGGSSFISGYAGVDAITSSADRTHTANTLHYSNKYFINGKMEVGVNEGNGKAKITYIGQNYSKTNTRLNNTRYIKDCVNGNTINASNHWIEIQAIYNGFNVAKGKSITGTSSEVSSNPYSRITDGDITYSNYAQAGTSGSLQCVTVDLTENYDLDEIAVWHYYGDTRSYNNHSLYVSSDNTNWTTLIDNVSGVTETSNGIRVSAYE